MTVVEKKTSRHHLTVKPWTVDDLIVEEQSLEGEVLGEGEGLDKGEGLGKEEGLREGMVERDRGLYVVAQLQATLVNGVSPHLSKRLWFLEINFLLSHARARTSLT